MGEREGVKKRRRYEVRGEGEGVRVRGIRVESETTGRGRWVSPGVKVVKELG
jgi:hypothetical protein